MDSTSRAALADVQGYNVFSINQHASLTDNTPSLRYLQPESQQQQQQQQPTDTHHHHHTQQHHAQPPYPEDNIVTRRYPSPPAQQNIYDTGNHVHVAPAQPTNQIYDVRHHQDLPVQAPLAPLEQQSVQQHEPLRQDDDTDQITPLAPDLAEQQLVAATPADGVPAAEYDFGSAELTDYPSLADLKKAIHEHGRANGYEMLLDHPLYNKEHHVYKYHVICKRHGKLTNSRKLRDDQRVRLGRKSKRTNCKVRLIAAAIDRKNVNGAWQLRKSGIDAKHNHPADGFEDLPGHRKRDVEAVASTIDALRLADVKPTKILTILRQQYAGDNKLFTLKDIQNYCKSADAAAAAAALVNGDQPHPAAPDLPPPDASLMDTTTTDLPAPVAMMMGQPDTSINDSNIDQSLTNDTTIMS